MAAAAGRGVGTDSNVRRKRPPCTWGSSTWTTAARWASLGCRLSLWWNRISSVATLLLIINALVAQGELSQSAIAWRIAGTSRRRELQKVWSHKVTVSIARFLDAAVVCVCILCADLVEPLSNQRVPRRCWWRGPGAVELVARLVCVQVSFLEFIHALAKERFRNTPVADAMSLDNISSLSAFLADLDEKALNKIMVGAARRPGVGVGGVHNQR